MRTQPTKSFCQHRSPHQFQCRPVRDLAWALLSPNLFLALPDTPKYWFLADYVDGETLSWLNRVDNQPEALYQHLTLQRSTRLGIYFEQLLSFYFEYFPRFELLAKNLQVNSKQRTLGEFDFILYDQKDRQTKHIEVAVKFYLGHPDYRGHIKNNTPLHNWHHWVGPNQRDSLAIKMRHLNQHQLTLSETEAGMRTLEKANITGPISSRLLIKGQFYLPLNKNISMPEFHNPELTRNYWVDSSTFLEDKNATNIQRHYFILPRTHWLSPLTQADQETSLDGLLSADELTDVVRKGIAENTNEWHIAELDLSNKNKIESKRFFIVNHQNLPSDK